MQKKLLTIAVAAALAAPAAMADVTVYGLMHYSVDWVDSGETVVFDNAGRPIGLSDDDDSEMNVGVSRQSRIGFKGAEDLGGGLKGVWQIEANIDNSVSEDAAGNGGFDFRNTFVGLAGGWGTVLLGRHDTPYKISTGKLDPFVDRVGDYNNLLGTIAGITAFDERAPQTLAYVTPNFSGFSAAAAYIQHYFKANTPAEVDADSDWGYSLMAMYDNAGFFATAAYEHQEGPNLTGVTWGALGPLATLGAVTDPEGDAWKVGLGYTFGGTTIGGIYENIEFSGKVAGDRGDMDRDAWWLTAQHAFGNNVVKGYYGHADDLGGDVDVDNSGADIWAVGYDYNFSKRTTLYAMYAKANNDDNATYGLTGPQSTSDPYTQGLLGEDVQSFSLGVIHKF